MGYEIFREQAIKAASASTLPTITLQPPRLGWLFCALGIFVLSVLAGLLWLGSYTSFAQADGLLTPSGGLLPVQTNHAGVVTKVFVKDGDHVQKGAPLLQLTDDQGTPTQGETQASILRELASKQSRLRDDLASEEATGQRQADNLKAKIAGLGQQIITAQHEVAVQKERADSAMSLYLTWDKASDTGAVSHAQVLAQHDTVLQLKAQVDTAQRTLMDLQRQLDDARSQLADLPNATAEKRRATQRNMSDVSQIILEHESLHATVLYAPVDGTVTSSLVHVGDALDVHEPAMSILPSGSKLRAELWLPSSDIGFVSVGDAVLLHYDAFPYRRYGQGKGVVVEVARTAVQPAQVLKWAGLQTKEPRYRVIVQLQQQSIRAFGADQPLLPGMMLKARVILQKRRLIEWATMPWKSM